MSLSPEDRAAWDAQRAQDDLDRIADNRRRFEAAQRVHARTKRIDALRVKYWPTGDVLREPWRREWAQRLQGGAE